MDVIQKVRKTLALAYDRGDTVEGFNAWCKAQELLSKHELTLDEVYSGKRRKRGVAGNVTQLLPTIPLPHSNKTKVIPWNEFFRVERDEMITLQIVPDRSVQSGRAVESILNTIHSMHETIFDRVWNEGLCIVFKTQDFASYRIVYEAGRITFYLVVPKAYQKTIRNSLENVWPKAAIHAVESPISDLDADKTLCAYLELRDHFFKATLVDRNQTRPIPSLMAAGRNVIDDDKAVLDVAFVPVGDGWKSRAESAREKYLRGIESKKLPSKWTDLLFMIGDVLVGGVIEKVFDLFDMAFGANPEKDVKKQKPAHTLKPATNTKHSTPGFNTVIRIASQSENKQRADLTLRSIGTAFKDLTLDNEFELKRVNKSKPFVEALKENCVPHVTINANILSISEASQILQLPTSSVQDEYPEVESIKKVEVDVATELTRDDVPAITIGVATVKQMQQVIRYPLAPYDGVRLKDVYDALCTPMFAFGKMGVGKTDGIGAGHALDMIKAGFTAFLLDTADGQVAKTLTDGLPDDYPEEKLIYLDFRNDRRAIPLTYADVAETVKTGNSDDDELAELKMSTRLTSHMLEFLNKQSTTGELTDRMRRYFISVAKATRGRPLQIQLALESPAYREELLSDPFVQSQPEVVADLQSLNERAVGGTERPIIDPILERMRMMERNQFLANVFYSDDKRDDGGNLLINFRHYADNPDGGYGYCVVIVCDKDTYGPEGQELICSTIQSKIFLSAYSRIDQDQSQRKPFISIADEPHRFIRGGAAKRLYSDAAVELRKYRCRTVMLAHSPNQLGDVWEAFGSGGAQIIAYKSENVADYRKLSNQLAPYDADYVYANLPEKWEAVCKLRLPSGSESPAFFCKMAAPPPFVKDRSKRRDECGMLYGYHWKQALSYVNETRQRYQQLDEQWFERIAEEKQAEKERRKAERVK